MASEKKYKTSYAIVNICIKIIQKEEKGFRYNLTCNYMVYVFKPFIFSGVQLHRNRIEAFMNGTTTGSYMSYHDIYQEAYLYFMELVRNFNLSGEIYFVIYLKKYMGYWGKNTFPIRKKDKVTVMSLETETSTAEGNQTKFMDFVQDTNHGIVLNYDLSSINQKATSVNEFEDKVIADMMVKDFYPVLKEKLKDYLYVKKNGNLIFNQRAYEITLKLYSYFFVQGNKNYSKIARELECTPQMVQYYLELIIRLFKEYLNLL